MKKIMLIFVLSMMAQIFSQTATAPSAGDGTSGNPYRISTLNNLYWIASSTANWNKNYIQTAYIDATETENWFSGSGWIPIGTYNTRFTGSYNGQGFIIDGLYVNRTSDYVGFIGYAYNAQISNTSIVNGRITGDESVGGLLGADGGSPVTNCSYSGSVNGRNNVGGLIGGTFNSATISGCYSEGMVTGTNNWIGGLIGWHSTVIVNNSYSISSVNGYSYIGGLTGISEDGYVNNCYSAGAVAGVSSPGGLIGSETNSSIVNSFWDTESSGLSISAGGTGKTSSEMQSETTFSGADWDFTSIWAIASYFNSGYPFLRWQPIPLTPVLSTENVTEILADTALGNGTLTSPGASGVIQHGVCWSISENPTISNYKTEEGTISGTGQFTSQMTGLSSGTVYYVRSYATNDSGTSYGNQVSFTTLPVNPLEPAGSGTEIDPYQIANIQNLFWINCSPERLEFSYIQINDINASETSTWLSGAGWVPIGSFSGTYDGQNYSIANLHINRPEEMEVALFLNISTNGTIKNLNLEGISIFGKSYVGSVAGRNFSTILNCHSSGSVSSLMSIAGGITGANYDEISNCSSSAIITGQNSTGGIAGSSDSSLIEKCYFDGTLNAMSDKIGGIVGDNDSSIIRMCYNAGKINGSKYVGGIAGFNTSSSSIINCYSIVDIDGYSEVGGIVGYNYNLSSVDKCYSSSPVTGVLSHIGGLIGLNENSYVTNSCWDTEASGCTWSSGGSGYTTLQMKTKSTYTANGWDLVGETANGTENIWNLDVFNNNNYPYLTWQNLLLPPSAGDGTVGNPYHISSLKELYWITEDSLRWENYYLQTSDIDAAASSSWFNGSGWSPIGSYAKPFTGSYDGQNFQIADLYSYSLTADYAGFIGKTDSALVKNVDLKNVHIVADSNVGGLIGFNSSSVVENCSCTGLVAGNTNTGGLVGANWNSSSVSRSWSDCAVTGSRHTGGLVGYSYNSSSINNCYSRSHVISSSYYGGGLIGQNFTSSVSNSYSTGAVTGELANIGGFIGYNNSTVSNCFWDTETSGLTKTSGGTGKTTAEMKAIATFTNAGWDFTGETTNGTNDYWNINTINNDGYPYLSWQIFVFEAPQNVNGTMNGADFILNWNEVSGASSYSVYSSADPYAAFPTGWTLAGSGITGLSWTDVSVTAAKKFYVVVAVSGKNLNAIKDEVKK